MHTKLTHSGPSRFLFALFVAALVLSLTACKKPADSAPPKAVTSKEQSPSEAKPAAPVATQTPAAAQATATAPAPAVSTSNSPTRVLVFRNVRSWQRKIDFEEVLTNLGFQFDVKSSAEMGNVDLSPYGFIIIPGAQWQDNYYQDYADNAARFDLYVTNGGTLVLELNGAEGAGIILPRGVSMAKHGATDNLITQSDHPILLPLAGQPIHANFASHGYLVNVPKDALILATEAAGEQPAMDKPTFLEYAHGKGRVIAACQCFHDQDRSGRGPLMETAISYAAEKQWFAPKK